jgi:hypothetical protein
MLEVTSSAWGGIVALIQGRISNGALGVDYPDECPDGRGPTGTDACALGLAVKADIPDLDWPLEPEPVPPTPAIMDLLEFCHDHVD